MPEPSPIKVGLWGPSSAGKTAFMAQLFLQPSDPAFDWEVFPTEDSVRFMDMVRPQIDQNRFPLATAVSETITKVAYVFGNRKTGASAELVVEDRPGADSESLTGENRQRLSEVQGLILLFDPEAAGRPLGKMIEQTLSRLFVDAARQNRKDDRPIAVCLSKADRLIQTPADLDRAINRPHDFVLGTMQRMDGQIIKWVERYCSNFELFPISSVGVRVRYGVVEPVVFRDERLELRMGSDGKPINLMAPFDWLFRKISEQQGDAPGGGQ